MSSKGFLSGAGSYVVAAIVILVIAGAVVYSPTITGLVTKDTEAPNVTIAHTPPDPKINHTITIRGQAKDNFGVESLDVFVDGVKAIVSCSPPAAGKSPRKVLTCIYTTSFAKEGNHAYYAIAKDKAGNVGRDPASGSKSVSVIGGSSPGQGSEKRATQKTTDGPTVIVSHGPQDPFFGQQVSIFANATVAQPNYIGLINVSVDGAKVNARCAPIATGWQACNYTTSTLSIGTHIYSAFVNDNKGRIGSASGILAVKSLKGGSGEEPPLAPLPQPPAGTTDTTKPTVSVAHTPASPQLNQLVTLAATATDSGKLVDVSVYLDNILVKSCASSPCVFSKTYSIAGTHTYYATAKDASNNVGRAPATYSTFAVGGSASTSTATQPGLTSLVSSTY